MIGRAPMMMAPPPGSMPMFAPAPPMQTMPQQMGMAQPRAGMIAGPPVTAPASPPAWPPAQPDLAAVGQPAPAGMVAGPPVAAPVTSPVWPPAQPGLAAGQPAPARTFRGQAEEEPASPAPEPPVEVAPAPLTIPSPDQLGVASVRAGNPTSTDWSAAHHRLDQLGALAFHEERIAGGGCRFICVLPTAQPNRMHRIEAEAASEAEAVQLTLDKAEAWAHQK
jgi:hypothetical protein